MDSMKRLHRNVALVVGLGLLLAVTIQHRLAAAATEPSFPKLIMIIRHGEKPAPIAGEKDPNLTAKGYQRADALATVIPAHFAKPDFLFATKKTGGSNRPVETITPLSKAIGEEINSTYKTAEIDDLTDEILHNPKYADKVVLIAWHHEKIPDLAKAFGVKDVPTSWTSSVFDRVWEITYVDGVAELTDLPQQALPGDSQQ
jgi:phosphohistidine phosphatase SixA